MRIGNILLKVYLIGCLLYGSAQAQTAKPLSRKQSFFGLHFDFHASKEDSLIGETFTREMIDSLLTQVQPDFVQVDCKGHPGISSYPTQVGTPAKSFTKDILQLWREVTLKHGVALYVHYSGVYDKRAIELHPNWAVVNDEGKIDSNNTSVHSAYADSLLIPQLKELSKNYGINGVWVDGDCWATTPDYSAASLQQFTKQTGIATIPYSKNDTAYPVFLQFSRQSFIRYVQHYTHALHEFNPAFQVASNWAYSSFMPEPIGTEVDFLSGDLTPVNSVYSAAFEARCLAAQGRKYHKPWDLMSWSFTMNWDRPSVQTTKSAIQLQQEAAEVIAMGGGFQYYFTQNRDGSIRPWQVSTMKTLAKFMRERQPYTQSAIPVPQIALVYSGVAHSRKLDGVFSNGGLDAIRGTLNALLDGQQAVEVLMEHHLQGHMKKYPLIIIPEWDYLAEDFRKELLAYTAGGGNLLVIGPAAAKLFEKEAGIRLNGPATEVANWLGYDGKMAALEGVIQPVLAGNNVNSIGDFYINQDLRSASTPASVIVPYGAGKMAAIYGNMGENYLNNASSVQRDFINAVVHNLFSKPLVQVQGSHLVHVAVDSVNKHFVVHLVNAGGNHTDKNRYAYDELPALGPLTVTLRMPRPNKIVMQPGNRPLRFSYAAGEAIVPIPSLDLHRILVIE